MPNVPTYNYQVPLRDAPDVEQDLKTSDAMFGGYRAKALDAWGEAFEKMGNAVGSFAKPEPTAAQVVYGDWERKAAKPANDFVSDRDWDYVATVREDYNNAQRTNDAAKFRETLTRVGGTLQSYPHLEPHLPKGAAQAYRDYRQAIDDDEARNFTAKGLSSTAHDRDHMAQAAAAKILGGLLQATSQGIGTTASQAAKAIPAGGSRWAARGTKPRALESRGPALQPVADAEDGPFDSQSTGDAAKQQPATGFRTTTDPDSLLKSARAAGGWLSGPNDRGSKECVAFVKYAVPELSNVSAKHGWKQGQKITAYRQPPIEPGTAIATFDVKGKYPSAHGKSHAAVFLSYGIHPETHERGMFVLDQHNAKKLSVNFISFDTRSDNFASHASNYSVIKR